MTFEELKEGFTPDDFEYRKLRRSVPDEPPVSIRSPAKLNCTPPYSRNVVWTPFPILKSSFL
jgi:hypothetical protein